MQAPILLITPPFTQLNTPYPATAYIKGFLNTKGIAATQADLGIEVILKLYALNGLQQLFAYHQPAADAEDNLQRMYHMRQHYIDTIAATISFLQGKNPALAAHICSRKFLPEAGRFANAQDLNWAFGNMGFQDKAKHLATLYIEDLADYITAVADPHFGMSRYAEKLGRSANKFDELYQALQAPLSFVEKFLIEILEEKMQQVQPSMVCISVPFPGNLLSAFRCGQYIKKYFPNCKVAMGGGFANTELRSLTDVRVFEFVDFITLDDGEAPLENLIQYLKVGDKQLLKRTFLLEQGAVAYYENNSCRDYKQGQVGTPDYSDLLLTEYISAIEVANPMHSLWSDGRWNKLTMAHGCYWGKCTFCDISLDYIKNYEPLSAEVLCNRIEEMTAQTGQTGFHFVDEAAPPALMKAMALEIIKRKLVITWWANIRFEKSFTKDTCLLLKQAGCIAVSGGLEVASDRLLKLIEKGITVAQVAQVNKNFTEAGIMVHAYLMYGFPTQSEQETIDSLEMVRQLFQSGVLQSAFWHLFTMTAHSPVGLHPEKFKVKALVADTITFANNDVLHEDEMGADHETFGQGLKTSLFNYMQGIGLDLPLHKWFEFKVPRTSISPNYIADILTNGQLANHNANTKVIWLGQGYTHEIIAKSKKGMQWENCNITFYSPQQNHTIKLDKAQGEWLLTILPLLVLNHNAPKNLQFVKAHYEAAGLEDFELFWDNKPINTLGQVGLLHL